MFARNAMQPLESWRRGRFGYALMTMLRRNSERRITRFITIIQEGMEFDFVIEDSRSGEVKVIEVKSGKDYKRHSALNNLMDSGAVKTQSSSTMEMFLLMETNRIFRFMRLDCCRSDRGVRSN